MKKLLVFLVVLGLLLTAGCAGMQIPTIPPAEEESAATTTAAPDTAELPTTEAPATTELPFPTEEPETEPVSEPETTASVTIPAMPVDPWAIPDVSFFDEGFYEDELGNSWTWSYELPCLNADTPGAKEINETIDATIGADVRQAQEDMEEKLSLVLTHVGSRWELWEDVLSLIVIQDTEWGFTNYSVFCYDVSTGEHLDTRALLKKMGVSEQDFLDTCRTQMIQYYKDMYAAVPEDQLAMYGYYDGLERQITSDYVNLDLMAYPEFSGDIVIIAPIVSLAGADYYYHEIYLGMGGVG